MTAKLSRAVMKKFIYSNEKNLFPSKMESISGRFPTRITFLVEILEASLATGYWWQFYTFIDVFLKTETIGSRFPPQITVSDEYIPSYNVCFLVVYKLSEILIITWRYPSYPWSARAAHKHPQAICRRPNPVDQTLGVYRIEEGL